MNETSAIQNWLAARLPAQEPTCPVLATDNRGNPGLLEGITAPTVWVLDEKHKTALREILQRTNWPRADFRAVAMKAGLMPGACFTTLNEWALNNYSDLLLEGDLNVNVNQNLKKNIHI